MSAGASDDHEHPGDEPPNPSSVTTAVMSPSNIDRPDQASRPGSAAETGAANGVQFNSGVATAGREGSYVPQFSAATEMILRRMRGEPTGEFDPQSSPNVDGWEEARAKVMMGMKTSMNMDMGPMPQTARRGSAQRAAATRAAASRTASASRRNSSTPGPAPAGGASSASTPIASGGGRSARGGITGTPTSATRGGRGGRGGSASKGGVRGGRGGKRKRQVKEESEESAEESDNMSKLGDDSSDGEAGSITNMPSMTSSGRQIQKPKNFNPVAIEGPPRKRAATKRIQEQALCKRCGRGHSPQSNMIVFCDGCNMGWHQMCHDPVVSDEVVQDEIAEWFCAGCAAEREPPAPVLSKEAESIQAQPAAEEGRIMGGQEQAAATQGQQTFSTQQQQQLLQQQQQQSNVNVVAAAATAGIGKSMEEKRAYLSMLPRPQLVALLLHAATLHPDLPICTAAPSSSSSSSQPPLSSHNLNQAVASNSATPHPSSSNLIPVTYPAKSPYHSTQQQPQQHISASGFQPINAPRFPSQTPDRRTNIYPQQPFPPSASTGLFSRAEANPNAPINFIRKIPEARNGRLNGIGGSLSLHGALSGTAAQPSYPGQGNTYVTPTTPQTNPDSSSSSMPQQQQQSTSAFNSIAPGAIIPTSGTLPMDLSGGNGVGVGEEGAEEEDDDDSRESTSPPYPRPGNGLMRKLPPDDQDLEWLEDKGDYEAFSHVVYDADGRGEKIEENGVSVIGNPRVAGGMAGVAAVSAVSAVAGVGVGLL